MILSWGKNWKDHPFCMIIKYYLKKPQKTNDKQGHQRTFSLWYLQTWSLHNEHSMVTHKISHLKLIYISSSNQAHHVWIITTHTHTHEHTMYLKRNITDLRNRIWLRPKSNMEVMSELLEWEFKTTMANIFNSGSYKEDRIELLEIKGINAM